MEWEYKVTMDLGFDCTPPPASAETPWQIADATVDRIEAFLSTEPEGSNAEERFSSRTSKLHMRVEIPLTAVSAAGVLLTKLKNNLDLFPPLLEGELPRFDFIAQGVPDPMP